MRDAIRTVLTQSASTAARSAFLTVAVTNRRPNEPSPGNYDPRIPSIMADNVASSERNVFGEERVRLDGVINDFTMRSRRMTGGGTGNTWWQSNAALANEMTYECDANLGAPTVADCAHIEWSELGPDEESFSLAEGAVKFLSSSESTSGSNVTSDLIAT